MTKEPLFDDFINLEMAGDKTIANAGNQQDYNKSPLYDDDDFESLEFRANRALSEDDPDEDEEDTEVGTPEDDTSKEDNDDKKSKTTKTSSKKEEDDEQEDEEDEEDNEEEEYNYTPSESVETEIPSLLKFLSSEKVLELPKDFKPEHSLDSLVEVMEYNMGKLQDKARESFISSLPEEVVSLVKYTLANKNASIDDYLEEFGDYTSVTNNTLDLTRVNIEDEDQQKAVYKYYLKATTKYSDEKINKQIDLLDKNAELYFEAKEALNELITMEAQARKEFDKKQDELMKDRLQREKDERQQYINTIKSNENIPNDRKQKLQNFIINKMTVGNGMQVNGLVKALNDLGKNPDHVVQLADLLLDYDPKKGINLDRFISMGKSQKTKEIKKQLDDTTRDRKIGGRRGSRATKGFDWEK
jgi:hypothetical protein